MNAGSSATARIANWVAGRDRAPLSPRVTELATISVVDTIAGSLAGTCEPGPWRLMRTRATSSSGQSAIWGMGGATSARDAALLNGMLAHMQDYDDGDMVSRGHPSCICVPALFAVGEAHRKTGQDVLDGWLTAWNVTQAIGSVCGKSLAERGYHVTSAIGVVAAAAGLCRMLGLPAEQVANAMGMAATMASGVRASFGTDMKGYNAGRAAMAAVEAVEATVAGVTAPRDVLEGHDGFLDVLSGRGQAEAMELAAQRLEDGEISVENEPPIIKLYPSCHSTHACIEAARHLSPMLAGKLDEVSEIVADGPRMSELYLIHHRPRTGLEAKFSMEGAIALALVDGKAGVGQFSDSAVQRPEVQALIDKVRYVPSDRMDEFFKSQLMSGGVRISLGDTTVGHEVVHLKGCRSLPCTFDDVRAKFRDCAAGVLAEPDAEAALAGLCGLDRATDLGSIGSHLRGGTLALAVGA